MGLLDSGPYANFDPKKDPYLQRFAGQKGPGRGIPLQQETPQGLLDQMALSTMAMPVVGDVVGAASDIGNIIADPSPANISMGLLGAMPFIPSVGAIRRVGGPAIPEVDGVDFYRGIAGKHDGSSGVGEYFTDSPNIAESYIPQNVGGERGKVSGQMLRGRIDPKNPLVIDMEGAAKSDRLDQKYFAEAKRNGNDAVVFLNIRDAKSSGVRSGSSSLDFATGGELSTVVVPLSESAIPSAFDAQDIVRDIKMRPKVRTAAEEAALDAEVDEIMRKMLEDEFN